MLKHFKHLTCLINVLHYRCAMAPKQEISKQPIKKQWHRLFKGSLAWDFQLQVFFTNQFPWAPEYPMRTVTLQIFENSLRYSRMDIYQRCQWHRDIRELFWGKKNFRFCSELSCVLFTLVEWIFAHFSFSGMASWYWQHTLINGVLKIYRQCRWHKWTVFR